MSGMAWHGKPIGKHHDREAFDCGDAALNEFLRRYARKSHELGGAKTFLAMDDGGQTILGFYSLSAASVAYAQQVPELVKRGLARHEVRDSGSRALLWIADFKAKAWAGSCCWRRGGVVCLPQPR